MRLVPMCGESDIHAHMHKPHHRIAVYCTHMECVFPSLHGPPRGVRSPDSRETKAFSWATAVLIHGMTRPGRQNNHMVTLLGVTCESSRPRSAREREGPILGAGPGSGTACAASRGQSGVTSLRLTSDAMSGSYGTAIGAIALEDATEIMRAPQHGSTLSPRSMASVNEAKYKQWVSLS